VTASTRLRSSTNGEPTAPRSHIPHPSQEVPCP
jgi:hypothetical protein